MDELDQKLAAAAKACSEDAVNRAFAAGLSILVARDGQLVRLFPDGREEGVGPVGAACLPRGKVADFGLRASAAYADPVRRFRVVAGPNGSGKSTLRSWLTHDYAVNFYTFLNADDVSAEVARAGTAFVPFAAGNDELRAFVAASSYADEVKLPFLDGRIRIDGECVRFADGAASSYAVALWVGFLQAAFVARGLSFSQETVFSHDSKVAALAKAREAGYRTNLYFVATDDAAINASRVANREKQGGHAVPEEKIAARYGRSLANVAVALPVLSRAYFFDNSGSTMRFIAEYDEEKGLLLKVSEKEIPAWFTRVKGVAA